MKVNLNTASEKDNLRMTHNIKVVELSHNNPVYKRDEPESPTRHKLQMEKYLKLTSMIDEMFKKKGNSNNPV